jgi:hypothetical protein
MRNHQIHNYSGIPLINTGIKTLFKNVHANLKDIDRSHNYQLGIKIKIIKLIINN